MNVRDEYFAGEKTGLIEIRRTPNDPQPLFRIELTGDGELWINTHNTRTINIKPCMKNAILVGKIDD